MGKTHSNGVEVATGFKNSNPAPIDDRYLVDTFNDLLDESSIISASLYKWMPVVANDTGALYTWNGSDRTNADNWVSQSAQVVTGTRAEILALRDSNNLTPLARYQMTDFKTVYTQLISGVVSDSAQGITDGLDTSTEAIILFATSSNTFAPQVQSLSYPGDIIYYDIDLDSTDGGSANHKGTIVYRKNTEYNLECDFDFMNVKHRRYALRGDAWVSGTTYSADSVVSVGDAIYRSLESSNLGNNPTATENDKWTKVLDKNDSTNLEYLAANSSELMGRVPADSADYIDCYTICNVADLTNPLPTYNDGNLENVIIRGRKANITIQIDGESGWMEIHNNVFELAEGDDLTIRTNDVVRGCKMVSGYGAGQIAQVAFTSDMYSVTAFGVPMINSLVNGLELTNILQLDNALCVAGYGINQWNLVGFDMGDFRVKDSVIESDWEIFPDGGPMHIIGSVVKNVPLLEPYAGLYLRNSTVDGGFIGADQFFARVFNSTISGRLNDVRAGLDNCTIEGDLDFVGGAGSIWNGVTIPSNVSLSHILFSIPKWDGENTWSGGALNLSEVTIDKRYSSGGTEKLWYKTTDINGIDTYTLLE